MRKVQPLPKTAGDIVLRKLLFRVDKNLFGIRIFDQFPNIEEGDFVTDPSGLLHIVGDDDDRILRFEFVDQLFDLGRRNGVKRRSRLVHQYNGRLNGQCASYADSLLLTSGKGQR